VFLSFLSKATLQVKAVFDLDARRWIGKAPSVDALWQWTTVYMHKSPDLYNLPRNEKGEVRADERPERIDWDAAMDLIEARKEDRRGKSEASLRNLKPRRHGLMPRPRVVDDESIRLAREMRQMGEAWSVIGQMTRQNPHSIKAAVRRQGTD
jgi:hypothetical protein